MVKAFNITFGEDENDIEVWERLCVLVRKEPISDTLEARREVSKPFYFPSFDFRSQPSSSLHRQGVWFDVGGKEKRKY